MDNESIISNTGCQVRFSVEDTGIGIREEDISKLFKMFGKIEQKNKNINP
jgi:signal transduction histidine kinase